MNPWPFVTAAYAVTLGGGAILAMLSYLAMRKAEKPVVSPAVNPAVNEGER